MAFPKIKITKRGAWLHARTCTDSPAAIAGLNLITGELWGCVRAFPALRERAKAYPEQEPRTREEMNAAKIRTGAHQCVSCENFFNEPDGNHCPHCKSGNFVKGCIDEPEPSHADEITLIRVRSLSQLKKDGEECEYDLYERDNTDGRLNLVFFQVNYEALRVYIDHKPDEQPHDEKHDDEQTEYYDIDGDECAVFEDCALFIRSEEVRI